MSKTVREKYFPQRLKALKVENKEFAEMCGIDPTIMSGYMSGTRTLSLPRLDLIDDKLRELENNVST